MKHHIKAFDHPYDNSAFWGGIWVGLGILAAVCLIIAGVAFIPPLWAPGMWFFLGLVPFTLFNIGVLTYDEGFTMTHRNAINRYKSLDAGTRNNLSFNEHDLAGMDVNTINSIDRHLNDLVQQQQNVARLAKMPVQDEMIASIQGEIDRLSAQVRELKR